MLYGLSALFLVIALGSFFRALPGLDSMIEGLMFLSVAFTLIGIEFSSDKALLRIKTDDPDA